MNKYFTITHCKYKLKYGWRLRDNLKKIFPSLVKSNLWFLVKRYKKHQGIPISYANITDLALEPKMD